MNPLSNTWCLSGTVAIGFIVLLVAGGPIPEPSPDAFLRSEALQDALHNLRWEQVLELIPDDTTVTDDPRVRLLAGHASYALGNANSAALLFFNVTDSVGLVAWHMWTDSLRVAHPGSAVAHYLYGDALARLGQFDEALHSLAKALEHHPTFCSAYNARGAIYSIQGSIDSAYTDFVMARELRPTFADTYANLGVLELQRGLPGAETSFNEALALDSTHALAYNGQACLLAIPSISKSTEWARSNVEKAANHLGANPYIVENARALTDPSDTTSVLGRIAHSERIHSDRGAMSTIVNAILPDQFSLGLTGPSVSWTMLKMPDVGGVRFDYKSTGGSVDSLRTVATDFVLAYPRPKKAP